MTRSFFLLFAGAIAIGFAPIFVRLASTGPISTAFWRMALAVPVLWMFVRQQNDAVYLLVMSVARERATASSLAFASSLLSTLTLLPIVPLAGEKLFPSAVSDWAWLIGLALISQVFGQTAIAHALGRIPPAQAAVGLLVQPVSAAVFAWVLFGESMSGLQLFGGALVLASITAVRLFER